MRWPMLIGVGALLGAIVTRYEMGQKLSEAQTQVADARAELDTKAKDDSRRREGFNKCVLELTDARDDRAFERCASWDAERRYRR